MLVIARFVQGIGGGGLYVVSLSTVAKTYPRADPATGDGPARLDVEANADARRSPERPLRRRRCRGDSKGASKIELLAREDDDVRPFRGATYREPKLMTPTGIMAGRVPIAATRSWHDA